MSTSSIGVRNTILFVFFLCGSLSAEILTWKGYGNETWDLKETNWLNSDQQEQVWSPGSFAAFKIEAGIFVADDIYLSGITVSREVRDLDISGGALHFDSPALIQVSNRLTRINSSVFSTNGLVVEAKAGPCSDRFLTNENQLLFENVSLDRVQAIDGNFRGYVKDCKLPAQGFHLRRNGSTLAAQMEVVDSGLVKCVDICLEQEESNIVGRATNARYIEGESTGVDFNYPLQNGIKDFYLGKTPSEGYGISDLRLSLADGATGRLGGHIVVGGVITNRGGRLEFSSGKDFMYNEIENENGTIEFSGSTPFILSRSLSGRGELRVNGGADDLYWVSGKNSFVTLEPTLLFPNRTIDQLVGIRGQTGGAYIGRIVANGYYFKRSGDVLTIQMQAHHGNTVKAIGVEISQRGPDLYIKGLWARYKDGGLDQVGQFDFENPNLGYGEMSLATTLGGGGYGIYDMELQFTGGTETVLSQNSTGSLSKTGSCYSSHYTIDDVVTNSLSADMISYYDILQPHENVKVCFVKRIGDSLSAQVQIQHGKRLKCVWIEIFQQEGWLLARVVKAGSYEPGQEAGTVDLDQVRYKEERTGSYGYGGYGVKDLQMKMKDGTTITCLKEKNTLQGTLTAHSGVLRIRSDRAFSPLSSMIADGENGILELDMPESNGPGKDKVVEACNGGMVVLKGRFNLGKIPTTAVKLEGGVLYCPLVSGDVQDCDNYMNRIELKNGSRIVGADIRLGGNERAAIRVTGTRPSLVDTGIILVNTGNEMCFEVEDVTGDEADDLTIKGGLRDFTGYGFGNLRIQKNKPGTLRLEGADSGTGQFEIKEGTVRFAGTKENSRLLVLDGGSVVVESDVGIYGELALKKDATLLLDGGSIAFNDCSELEWIPGVTLKVTGELGKKSIRFGTDSTGLTADQLAQIRCNGHRVLLTAEGYLTTPMRGTLILLN